MAGSVVAVLLSTPSGDKTPNAVNWTNISASDLPPGVVGTTNTQTISGINVPIQLKVTWTNSTFFNGSFSVYVNSVLSTTASDANLTTSNFTVQSGDTVYFEAGLSNPEAASWSTTMTVVNVSAGNATLDTFTTSLTIT